MERKFPTRGGVRGVPSVTIPNKKTYIGIAAACEFQPERADIYVAPQGTGKGVKVAVVASKTGSFAVSGRGGSSPGGKSYYPKIACKQLLHDELDHVKPGRYETLKARVHGKEAIIFAV
jgi:hypothetical protein